MAIKEGTKKRKRMMTFLVMMMAVTMMIMSLIDDDVVGVVVVVVVNSHFLQNSKTSLPLSLGEKQWIIALPVVFASSSKKLT